VSLRGRRERSVAATDEQGGRCSVMKVADAVGAFDLLRTQTQRRENSPALKSSFAWGFHRQRW